MNIAATQFTLSRRAFEIYVSGCAGLVGKHCHNCHNPELWDFSVGTLWNDEKKKEIKETIDKFPKLIDSIMIFGGEPLDQNHEEFIDLLKFCKDEGKEIWLFTGKEFRYVPEDVKELCDYIKCGRYLEEVRGVKEMYGIKLASENQRIYKKGVDYFI